MEEHLEALCSPKSDGGERPLGIPALEDRLVLSAVARVLHAIYEVDFTNFSYGFRPGRDAHQALAARHTELMTQNVNWVLDADLFFLDPVDNVGCSGWSPTGSPTRGYCGWFGSG